MPSADITYKKIRRGWGMAAEVNGQSLSFGGDFESQTIRSEQVLFNLHKTLSIILYLFGLLSLAIFVSKILMRGATTLPIFAYPSPLNMVMWAGFLALLYQWARLRQQDIENSTMAGLSHKTDIEVYELFDLRTKQLWNRAGRLAKARNQEPGCADIFLSLLNEPEVKNIFCKLEIKTADLKIVTENYLKLMDGDFSDQPYLKKLPFEAFVEAKKLKSQSISGAVLLCALAKILPGDHIIKNIFSNVGITAPKLETWTARTNKHL